MMHFAMRTIVMLTAAWSLAVLDCGIAPHLELHGSVPSTCLIAAMLAVTLSSNGYAFLLAGAFGLAADLAGAGPMGAALGCYALIGYGVARLRGTAKSIGLMRASLELMVGSLAATVLLGILNKLRQPDNTDWSSLMQHAFGAGVYSIALGLPLLVLVLSTRSALRPLTPDP